MTSRVPAVLTISEAGRVLRIGRTKAYAMVQEWRATGGRSGLPVARVSGALRVPVCQLEALLGGPLTAEMLEAALAPDRTADEADRHGPVDGSALPSGTPRAERATMAPVRDRAAGRGPKRTTGTRPDPAHAGNPTSPAPVDAQASLPFRG